MARHVLARGWAGGLLGADRLKWTGAKAFILYQSGPLCIVLTTLLVWPFLGRILTQNQLGEVSMNLAVASVTAPALAVGAHLYLANRFASARGERSSAEAGTALSLTSALYLLAATSLCGSFMLGDPSVLMSLALSSASAAYLVTAGVSRGINRPAAFAVGAVVVQVLGLLGLGLATAATGDLRRGVLVYVTMIGIPVALQFVWLWQRVGTVKWGHITRTLRPALRLVPHLVLAVALLTMMRVMVAVQLGNEAAANYTFASLIIGGSLTIGASLDGHWSVRAQAALSSAALSTALSRNQARTQLILLATSLGVVLFLYAGLPTWLPDGYDSRGIILAVLCALPAASLQALADGRAAVLMWIDRPGLVSSSTAFGTTVTIALAYFLLPDFGWQMLGLVLTAGMSIRALATAWSARIVFPASRIGSHTFFMLGVQSIFATTLIAFI